LGKQISVVGGRGRKSPGRAVVVVFPLRRRSGRSKKKKPDASSISRTTQRNPSPPSFFSRICRTGITLRAGDGNAPTPRHGHGGEEGGGRRERYSLPEWIESGGGGHRNPDDIMMATRRQLQMAYVRHYYLAVGPLLASPAGPGWGVLSSAPPASLEGNRRKQSPSIHHPVDERRREPAVVPYTT
jgi:hypothetical protein